MPAGFSARVRVATPDVQVHFIISAPTRRAPALHSFPGSSRRVSIEAGEPRFVRIQIGRSDAAPAIHRASVRADPTATTVVAE